MQQQKDVLWQEVEGHLDYYRPKLSPLIFGRIRAILRKNHRKARIKSLTFDRMIDSKTYVDQLVQNYLQQHGFIEELTVLRDEECWKILHKKLVRAAYARLYGLRQDVHERETLAQEYANEVAICILTSDYPYDTTFSEWMHIIVRHVCAKGARHANTKKRQLEREAVVLDEWIHDRAEGVERQVGRRQALLSALGTLNEREVGLVENLELGYTQKEIANKEGYSESTISRLRGRVRAKITQEMNR